jgi:hypothetical protein
VIKLFRHIRLNLMETGKTVKYFKYDIGEIIFALITIITKLKTSHKAFPS